ncbi:MAG: phosphatase PAP2 family protein [Bacilli bacterium]
MKKYIKWIVMVIFLILFSVFAYKIVMNKSIYIDNIVYDFICDNFMSERMTNIVKILTSLGSALVIIILTIVLFIAIKNKKIAISVVINLIVITILNNLLKIIFLRPRPDVNNLILESGYSFPSGHSATGMAFYGYLIYLIYKYVNNKKIKIPLIIFLSLIIVAVGLSRIYLGVHYASDVLGGFLLAIVYLIIFITIANKYIEKK